LRARAALRKLIEETFGSKPARVHRESEGLTNIVFSVEHNAGNFIVRLNPKPEKFKAFQKEAWVTAQARKAGVPVPKILKVGREPMPYMILRKTQGQAATSSPDRLRILHQLGEYGALINSIRTHGFGESFDWAEDGNSQPRDWLEFVYGELHLDHRLKVLRVHKMLGKEQLAKVQSVLDRACRKGRTCALNHGDLRLKNVIVDARDRVVAILDWEHCISSLAPEWELSLALHDLTIDEKHKFLDGYGVRLRDLRAMAPAMKALNIINYVAEIERLATRGKTKELDFFRLRLKGVLDLYSI